MKLREYIANLNTFVEEHPEALNMDVVTAIDDEGNDYNTVWAKPSIGILDEFGDYMFHEDDVNDSEDEPNVVCVN